MMFNRKETIRRIGNKTWESPIPNPESSESKESAKDIMRASL